MESSIQVITEDEDYGHDAPSPRRQPSRSSRTSFNPRMSLVVIQRGSLIKLSNGFESYDVKPVPAHEVFSSSQDGYEADVKEANLDGNEGNVRRTRNVEEEKTGNVEITSRNSSNSADGKPCNGKRVSVTEPVSDVRISQKSDESVYYAKRLNSINEDELIESLADIAQAFKRISLVEEPQPPPSYKKRSKVSGDAVLLITLVILCNILNGINYMAFSVYYSFITDSLDVSKATAGFVGSVQGAVSCFVGIFISPAVQSFGCRPLLIVGGCVVTASLILSYFTTNVYTLCATYGFIGGCGVGIISLCSAVEIQQTFDRNRALAQGITMLGYSVGQIVGSIVIGLLIDSYGWRGAMLVHGALIAHLVPIGLTFGRTKRSRAIQRANRSVAPRSWRAIIQEIFNFDLLRNSSFVLFCSSIYVYRTGNTAFMAHTPSIAIFLGMSLAEAALLMSIVGMSFTGSRIVCALISNLECTNRVLFFSSGLLISGTACMFMLFAVNFLHTALLCSIAGAGFGISSTLVPTLLADLFGIRNIVRSTAVSNLFYGAANLSGIPLAGWLFDMTGNYDISFLVIGGLLVAAALLMTLIFVLDKFQAKSNSGNSYFKK